MKDNVIKVLRVEPKKKPENCLLKNELESLQEAVSIGADYTGLIEIINIDRGVCLLFYQKKMLNSMLNISKTLMKYPRKKLMKVR